MADPRFTTWAQGDLQSMTDAICCHHQKDNWIYQYVRSCKAGYHWKLDASKLYLGNMGKYNKRKVAQIMHVLHMWPSQFPKSLRQCQGFSAYQCQCLKLPWHSINFHGDPVFLGISCFQDITWNCLRQSI